MSRKLLAIPVVLSLLLAAAACTPRDTAQDDCLGGDRPVVTVPADHTVPWPGGLWPLPDDTAIDARGQFFDHTVTDANGFATGVKFHDKVGSRDNLCFVGGTILTTREPENNPWDSWHRIAGMTVLTPNFEVIGTSFFNTGDMVQFGPTATNWKVTGVRNDGGGQYRSGYIHDDCIENDSMNSGVVNDSKLEGCLIFLSSFYGGSGTPIDGSANTVEVKNSLIWVQPYRNAYNPAKYGYDSHGGFFKWAINPSTDGKAPRLDVHDSTFRADDAALYGGNANGFLALPPGSTCRNVTLINTAAWPAGDLASWRNQCTNITYGTTADWNAKAAGWDETHGAM